MISLIGLLVRVAELVIDQLVSVR